MSAAAHDLAYATRANCPVQVWRALLDRREVAMKGGPVLTAPEELPLRHWHRGAAVDDFEPAVVCDDYLAGTWNYLGPVHDHFGHVMSEFIHRVLPARRIFKHDQWLAVAREASPVMTFETCPPVYREVLSLLGIGAHNLKIINRDTIVERLNLVAQGTQIGCPPDPAYLDDLWEFTHWVLDPKFDNTPAADRVYVSRSKIDRTLGNFLGESCIEAWLAEEGFTIFHPQDHPLIEQLRIYRKAKILIFGEGSACHGVELFGPEALGQVCLVPRRPNFFSSFRGVFVPRARHYQEIISASTLLEPITSAGGAEDLWHLLWAQALFDLDILGSKLREFGVARLAERDKGYYMKCAAEDFEQHVAAWQASSFREFAGFEINSARVDRIRAQLGAAVPSMVPLAAGATARPTLSPDLTGMHYLAALQQMHQILAPLTYLEIGTASGESLALAGGTAIAVDPNLTGMRNPMLGKASCLLFQMSSDEFFEQHNPVRLLDTFVDLAFVDGMHLFEYLLRDIINVEKCCGPHSIVVLHDCVPTDAGIAERENDPALKPAHPYWWAGDVWKVVPILRAWRPDLKLTILDSSPTGLVVIQGLDPRSAQLTSNYGEICTKWFPVTLASYGLERFLDELNIQSTEAFLADLKGAAPSAGDFLAHERA